MKYPGIRASRNEVTKRLGLHFSQLASLDRRSFLGQTNLLASYCFHTLPHCRGFQLKPTSTQLTAKVDRNKIILLCTTFSYICSKTDEPSYSYFLQLLASATCACNQLRSYIRTCKQIFGGLQYTIPAFTATVCCMFINTESVAYAIARLSVQFLADKLQQTSCRLYALYLNFFRKCITSDNQLPVIIARMCYDAISYVKTKKARIFEEINIREYYVDKFCQLSGMQLATSCHACMC